MTTFYSPRRAIGIRTGDPLFYRELVENHFNRVYADLGQERPPLAVTGVTDAVGQEPTLQQVLQKLQEQLTSATPATAKKFTTEAIASIQRAQAADLFRDNVLTAYSPDVDGLAEDAAEDLQPVFEATVKELQKLAPTLDGEQPMDPSRAFAKGAKVADFGRVTELLQKLGTLASLHRAPTASDYIGPNQVSVLAVVNVPNEEPGYFSGRRGLKRLINPSVTRDEARAFLVAADQNPDDALVKLAQGRWPGLDFDYAGTHDEWAARVQRSIAILRDWELSAHETSNKLLELGRA